MPAIRDQAWNATAVATGSTLAIPVPAYEVGDLLLAIFMADTALVGPYTGGTPPSGSAWAHVTGSPSTNTCQLMCMWKYAVASEPASYTFTSASGTESFNGSIISIRDVHASAPFGSPAVINFATQTAVAKFNMQQITTNVANALIVYASANSSAGVPSLIEGPVYGLVGADGLAESLGIGWTFEPTVGLTPSNVGVSNIATGAGVRMAIQIAPPAAGAAVIPAYCAADSSAYLDPLNGTTAFNGNTGMAATADTNFGTSIAGFTTGDATVTATTDVGINSFHSAARLTSASGVTTPGGAEVVLVTANKPANIAGKNILVHLGPSSEGQLQRFSTVASGRGIWMGLWSSAGNRKVWQVYGAERGALRQQPIVINPSATSTINTAGTLSTTAATMRVGFWVAGTGVTTTAWDFVSMWLVDTVTVCGGNALEPVGVAGIVASAATGKERRSVIRQGANQALAYQPIQLGDGGTNPIYLDLDATAIEFPRQYNKATAEVNYNSIDNYVGLTYFAGATDTIKHRNSVISSQSKFHWRINAASSALATYDFSGLSIIGAGDVQLRAVTTFTGMAFSSCPTINTNGATLSGNTFSNSKVFVTSPASAALITSCTFTKTTGTSHAIEISGTAANIALSSLTFTGYASANGSTGNEAIFVNIASGTMNISISSGASPSIRTAGAIVNIISGQRTLSISGVVSGSDIVILAAGTTTELANIDANAGASYSYSYTYSANTFIDVCVYKAAYVPYIVRNYLLQDSDGSLPIAQVTDRNYLP